MGVPGPGVPRTPSLPRVTQSIPTKNRKTKTHDTLDRGHNIRVLPQSPPALALTANGGVVNSPNAEPRLKQPNWNSLILASRIQRQYQVWLLQSLGYPNVDDRRRLEISKIKSQAGIRHFG
ncbi:hypothetical protein CGMCC3_g2222 [Colletotrichum fructicola]|nr:uncharacterized protein CGMCC3_g2222 [Colletotrichum fructicola]KAE9581766.1 hypothetical protein CGMCC3_g2222 [Colletotrichum fructicola]